ncbi:MAG TPA: mechanosensitive ion channel domain-containing protein [Roseiflexaceae bacterium]|nr:mechanosensitive ion channel domain-containing protein [Roseiflexaceae bacterium]
MDIDTLLEGLRGQLIAILPNLLLVALILGVTSLIARRASGVITALARRVLAPPELVTVVAAAVRGGVMLVGLYLALNQLGWSGAALSLLGSLGIAGVVAGLALQDVAKQFVAGALLLTTRPFRIGDRVRVRAFEGVVLEMQLYATRLRTTVGEEVIMPNSDIISAPIVNLSRSDVRLRGVMLRVPREADVAAVRAAVERVLRAAPGVAAEPPPTVIETGFDSEKTRLAARFWVASARHAETTTAGVLGALRATLEQEGVQIEAEVEGG